MPESAVGRRGSARASMSIGEVLTQLRPEFPEITISKIRFLEDQGLVDPQRAPSGYRRFSAEDVERLRFVLAVQRDHYLPLRVIREHLEARDRGRGSSVIGAGVAAPAMNGPRGLVAGDGDADPLGGARVHLTRAELLRSTDASEELLSALESFGLVAGTRDGRYEADALVITRTAAELSAFGIEPRHLRAFRAAAEREAGLVAQVAAPWRQPRGATPSGQADEVRREVSALVVRLHAALLRAALGREGP